MADKTYAQLTAATDVQDTDLLATYRGAGPLKKLAASVFSTYVQTALTGNYLAKANNLSDVANAGTSRTNLGLGTAAVQNVGAFLQVANNLSELAGAPATARGNLGLGSLAVLNTVNDGNWSGTALAIGNGGSGSTTAAGARTAFGLGTAAVQNVGAFCQTANNLSDVANAGTSRTNLGLGTSATVNTGTSGATIPLLNGTNTWANAQTFSAQATFPAVTGNLASVLLTPSAGDPGTPVDGQLWCTSSGVGKWRLNGVTVTLGSASGNALLSTNNLSDVANVATSRTNLGLGTAATQSTGTFLQAANNLSDLNNAGTARTNLGTPTGTSGHVLPFLDGANTFGATQTLFTGTASNAPLKFVAGTNLTSPAAGAAEWDGTNLFLTQTTGPTRKTVAYTDSALSGNTTGAAAKWTTGRTITLTGDVTGASGAFDGSGNLSFAATIAAGAVTLADMANLAANSILGNNTGSPATPVALTSAQATAMLGSASTSTAGILKTATAAQVQGGSDATAAVTSSALNGSYELLGPFTISASANGSTSNTITTVRAVAYLLCTGAVNNYQVGDIIYLASYGSPGGSGASFGVGLYLRSTTLRYIIGANSIPIVNATTGGQFTAASANFSLYVQNWGY